MIPHNPSSSKSIMNIIRLHSVVLDAQGNAPKCNKFNSDTRAQQGEPTSQSAADLK